MSLLHISKYLLIKNNQQIFDAVLQISVKPYNKKMSLIINWKINYCKCCRNVSFMITLGIADLMRMAITISHLRRTTIVPGIGKSIRL